MPLSEPKSPLQSLAVNAGLGVLIVSILNVCGVQLSPDASVDIDRIITGLLALVAIYGRIRATRRVSIGASQAGPHILSAVAAIAMVGAIVSLTACANPSTPAPGATAQPAELTGKKLMLAAEAAYVATGKTIDALADVSTVPAKAKLDAADLLDEAYGMLVLARAAYAIGNAVMFEERAHAVIDLAAKADALLMPSAGGAK